MEQNLENEIWKPVVGYEGLYEVSNMGRVKSLSRLMPSKGAGLAKLNGRVLKFYITHRNYYAVQLGHKGKKELVHRLVAKSFVPNTEGKPQVNHKNGDTLDNRLLNLEWCTQSENQIHAYNTGLQIPFAPKGSDNSNSKTLIVLTPLGEEIERYKCAKEWCSNNGYSYCCVRRVIRGERKTYKGKVFKYAA